MSDERGPDPPGFSAIGVFIFFGAVMSALAAVTLLWQGTTLDHLWSLNPDAHRLLAPLGAEVGIPFLMLAAALTAAGVGWFRHRLWGWRLAVAIIATQLLGDIVNIVRGDVLRGAIGAIIAGALLLYLFRVKTRAAFV